MTLYNNIIGIANDNFGLDVKKHIIVTGIPRCTFSDYGSNDEETDGTYPIYTHKVAWDVYKKKLTFGVILSGYVPGVLMCANRIPHVRAAACKNPDDAAIARSLYDANILCLDVTDIENFNVDMAFATIRKFADTLFDNSHEYLKTTKYLTDMLYIPK